MQKSDLSSYPKLFYLMRPDDPTSEVGDPALPNPMLQATYMWEQDDGHLQLQERRRMPMAVVFLTLTRAHSVHRFVCVMVSVAELELGMHSSQSPRMLGCRWGRALALPG